MLDINEAPDKRAATLEKFLENCEHEDPYIQNIWMAACHMVTTGLGDCEYQTQYGSGTTLWTAARSSHSIPRIAYQPKKPKMVITIHRGLLASVVTDVSIDISILKVDEDTDDTIYREESLGVDPDYVAQKFAEAEKFWEEEADE
ncbi:MAG: hypothetical protein ABSH41_21675 [Syntrophobacteraceae bacterium]